VKFGSKGTTLVPRDFSLTEHWCVSFKSSGMLWYRRNVISFARRGVTNLELVSAEGLQTFNKHKPAHVSLFAANTAESRARFST